VSVVHGFPHESGGTHWMSQACETEHVGVSPPHPSHAVGKHFLPCPLLESWHLVPPQQSVSVEHVLRQQDGAAHFPVHAARSTVHPGSPQMLHDSGMHFPSVLQMVPLQHELPGPQAFPQQSGGLHFAFVQRFGSL
jgi:hypothetical protein